MKVNKLLILAGLVVLVGTANTIYNITSSCDRYDKIISKFPAHRDIYRNTSKADSTTFFNYNTLDDTVFQAKPDGTKVIQ